MGKREIPPVVGIIIIALVVVVAGYFMWRATGGRMPRKPPPGMRPGMTAPGSLKPAPR